jgi:hypothetical protein
MVIAFISGGLGNQMFEYAMARRLATVRNVELKLDLSSYQQGIEDRRTAGLENFNRKIGLNKLSVTAPEATEAEISRLKDPFSNRSTVARIVRRLRRIKPGLFFPATDIREKQFRFDAAMLDLPSDVWLMGLWQSEKYFADVTPQIRAEFAPKDPQIKLYAEQYVEKIRTAGGLPVVSLHVRRGDLAHAIEQARNTKGPLPSALAKYLQFWGNTISNEYLDTAMRKFGPEFQFLVFSDTAKDIEWCRQNIKPDWLPAGRMHFSDGHSDMQDMALMSACDHNIIANSTFSWWGAWLNPRPNRRVIAPRHFSAPGQPGEMVTDDLIPPSWEMIG